MDPRHIPFRDFHRTYFGRVTRYVEGLGVRGTDAGDVVQEVFLTAHQRRREVEHPAAMNSWLFGVASRHVANHRRRKWNAVVVLPGDDEFEATMVTSPRGAEAGRLELIALAAVVAELGDRERAAWLARYLDDLTLPQAAERCGCSLAEVKRRIARAEMAVEGVLEETVP